MGSRPRTMGACSSPSRRSPRLRSPRLLRRPLRRNLRKTQMPRRRRRRRRRPPSKCHLLTVKAVEKCSKHSFYLRALKITVIRLTVSNSICAAALCIIHSNGLRPILQTEKITKKREFAANKNSRKNPKKKKKKKKKK